MRSLYSYFNELEEQNTLLSYKGAMNASLLQYILDTTSDTLLASPGNYLTRQKVTHVVVECVQNVIKHLTHEAMQQLRDKAMICIHRTAQHYVITTGNIIS
ncbi:MAG: hypothetical protein HC842_06700, partial [Cytophagales bacterium]|nr:hypothetical protein [Cytophagales bacterium]